MVSILSSRPICPWFAPNDSLKILRGKIVNVAEVNQRLYLEESGQLLENVVQTQLVLASGKLLALQLSLLCCRCRLKRHLCST